MTLFFVKKSYLEQLNFFILSFFSNLKISSAFLIKFLNIISKNIYIFFSRKISKVD